MSSRCGCGRSTVLESNWIHCLNCLDYRYKGATKISSGLCQNKHCISISYEYNPKTSGIDRKFTWLKAREVAYDVLSTGQVQLNNQCPACIRYKTLKKVSEKVDESLAHLEAEYNEGRRRVTEAQSRVIISKESYFSQKRMSRRYRDQIDDMKKNLKRKRVDDSAEEREKKRPRLITEAEIDEMLEQARKASL